jgi:uncharacterized membrane protein YdjX (TVP38/TMEM64 family)
LKSFKRWIRIIILPTILIAAAGAYYGFGLGEFLSFETLARNREWLLEQVANNRIATLAAFFAVYAGVVALSVPGATILTVTSGFLFGPFLGTIYAVIGATIGAALLFLLARSVFRELFRSWAGKYLERLEDGFKRNALSYLLFLRLVPLVPFWLVNLVPALLDVSLRVFVIGTFFGIIPGTLVYASVGNGLGAILAQGGRPDLGIIFSPEILLPILGLAALALVPAIYRHFRGTPEIQEKKNG